MSSDSISVAVPVEVHAPWFAVNGPPLSLGVLTAYARSKADSDLCGRYTIERPLEAPAVLDRLASHDRPAILLCSDYMWCVDDNLEFARTAVSRNPHVLTIHGGPSAPSYTAESEAFLRQHGSAAAVLVHGEGEETLIDLLRCLDGQPEQFRDGRLEAVQGISFLDQDGRYVRTPGRERRADLNDLPSPYLTGEFDHIDTRAWPTGMYVESNRGCPYGCTYCDWGSLTLSRIRMFDAERVNAEISWAADRGFKNLSFCDANFGITRRDVAFVEHIRDEHVRTGAVRRLLFSPAKNTVRNLAEIIRIVRGAGIELHCDLGLQSVDPSTLAAIDRSNISTEKYLELHSELRRGDNYVPCDLMMGLPGQTPASFRSDLQFAFDHDILARVHIVRLLPNSPMNEPSYRSKFRLVVNDTDTVVESSTFSAEERARMYQLLLVNIFSDHLGVFRHVLRFVQWDHGVAALDVMQVLADRLLDEPQRVPALRSAIDGLLVRQQRPEFWEPVFEELRSVLVADFEIAGDTVLDAALDGQRFLLPRRMSTFPESLSLPHDFVAYYRSAMAELASGRAFRPVRPLSACGPGVVEVLADPLGLCTSDPQMNWGDSILGPESVFHLYAACFELLTPLRSSFAGRRFRTWQPTFVDLIERTAVHADR